MCVCLPVAGVLCVVSACVSLCEGCVCPTRSGDALMCVCVHTLYVCMWMYILMGAEEIRKRVESLKGR